MKKLSQRDWAIAIVIAVLSAITTFAATSMYYNSKAPITIENPLNEALKKRSDSLGGVLVSRELRIAELEKTVIYSDSVIVKNHKGLKSNSTKYENTPDSLKHHFVDSLLKIAGKR